jgi:hypothetical protein
MPRAPEDLQGIGLVRERKLREVLLENLQQRNHEVIWAVIRKVSQLVAGAHGPWLVVRPPEWAAKAALVRQHLTGRRVKENLSMMGIARHSASMANAQPFRND